MDRRFGGMGNVGFENEVDVASVMNCKSWHQGFPETVGKMNQGSPRVSEAKHAVNEMVSDGKYQYNGVWRNASFAVQCVIEP